MSSSSLLRNIRFYILAFSVLLSIGVFWINFTLYSGTDLFNTRLTEEYGLAAVIYLYISLLASPFTQAFSYFPFKGAYVKARRGTGVSAFYFALLHSLAGFLGPLDGVSGLGFLPTNWVWAVICGLTALLIMTYMALTSFDRVIEKMSYPVWKASHRTIYLGGILILIHTFTIGSHFSNLSSAIPQILIYALIVLLTLEAVRIDKYLYQRFLDRQSREILSPAESSASAAPPMPAESPPPRTPPQPVTAGSASD